MFSKELFGQRVLEQRKKSGETQKVLAQILGVGDTQVIEIEHGRSILGKGYGFLFTMRYL